jgi:hypothetical protein
MYFLPLREADVFARASSECVCPCHEPALGKILYLGESSWI